MHFRTGVTQVGLRFTAACACGFLVQATAIGLAQVNDAWNAVSHGVDDHIALQSANAGKVQAPIEPAEERQKQNE
jgi:hypothetical protein